MRTTRTMSDFNPLPIECLQAGCGQHKDDPQMPFRSIVADPQELQKLCDAFDVAWTALNSARPVDPLMAAAERERLGYIIVHLWQADPQGSLATQAVRQFLRGELAAPPPGAKECTRQDV